jgi:uncharacterized protein HemX
MNSDKAFPDVASSDSEVDDFDPFKTLDKQRPGNAVAWLALMLVLGLAAWSGWQWWLNQRVTVFTEQAASQQFSAMQSQMERQQQQLDALERTGESRQGQISQLEQAEFQRRNSQSDETALRDQLDSAQTELQALRRQLEQNQATLATLAERSESSGERVELAEVAFLLRAASERLVLFGDVAGAAQALGLADAQLVALDDPRYLPVRQSISAARQALEQAPQPDLVGLTQHLDQLQAQVPQLALKGEAPPPQPAAAVVEPGLWQQFKDVLSGLVTVRSRTDSAPLFTLEDKDYLRQGLWLQFESARLALLRNDPQGWAAALQRADDTLQQWFDGNDRQVQQAIADVDQLQQAELASALPDISGPWRTLDGLRQSPARLPAAARNPELTPVPVHGDAEGVVPALPVDDAEGAVAEPTVDDAG